jgi:hypothetical protein
LDGGGLVENVPIFLTAVALLSRILYGSSALTHSLSTGTHDSASTFVVIHTIEDFLSILRRIFRHRSLLSRIEVKLLLLGIPQHEQRLFHVSIRQSTVGGVPLDSAGFLVISAGDPVVNDFHLDGSTDYRDGTFVPKPDPDQIPLYRVFTFEIRMEILGNLVLDDHSISF